MLLSFAVNAEEGGGEGERERENNAKRFRQAMVLWMPSFS